VVGLLGIGIAAAAAVVSSAVRLDVDAVADVLAGVPEFEGIETGRALRILIKSSMQRYTAPDTPSRTLRRSSIASLVTLSMSASCSSVNVGGSWDIWGRCWYRGSGGLPRGLGRGLELPTCAVDGLDVREVGIGCLVDCVKEGGLFVPEAV